MKQYIKDSDTAVVEFDTEVGVTYNYCIEKEARAGKIKLALSTEKKLGSYKEICQIGAVVEVKWTKDDLATQSGQLVCVFTLCYKIFIQQLNDHQLELNSSCLDNKVGKHFRLEKFQT